MAIEIKHKVTGDVLYKSNKDSLREAVIEAVAGGANLGGANLGGANLGGANLGDAYLGDAYLGDAYLRGANLGGAYLRDAYLGDAYLGDAYLGGANLRGAKGISLQRSSPLALLLDQPGPIRAYKLVTAKGEGPYNGGIIYEVGKPVSVDNADTDPNELCAAGINVADSVWISGEWRESYRILIVEFTRADIACIPLGTDGKFRLHRCDVVGEINPADWGLGVVDQEVVKSE